MIKFKTISDIDIEEFDKKLNNFLDGHMTLLEIKFSTNSLPKVRDNHIKQRQYDTRYSALVKYMVDEYE